MFGFFNATVLKIVAIGAALIVSTGFFEVHWVAAIGAFFVVSVINLSLVSLINSALRWCYYCKKKIPIRENFLKGFDYHKHDIVCSKQECKSLWDRDTQQREKEKAEKKERKEQARKEFLERRQKENESASSTAFSTDRRDRIPTKLRQRIWARDGGQCCNCGQTYDLHFDHIIPVSKGGSNTEENLELLCSSCNLSKSAKIQ